MLQVLVDVPCYTDRHVLLNEENNIFRPIRMAERLQLQEIQRELLLSVPLPLFISVADNSLIDVVVIKHGAF